MTATPTQATLPQSFVDVVFDGPPSAQTGRFVECEDPAGCSYLAGQWIDRGNGLWALRISLAPSEARDVPTIAADLYRVAHYGALVEFNGLVRSALATRASEAAPPNEPAAIFVLRALLAAGHVSQGKVDEAFAIAAATPGVEAAPAVVGDASETASALRLCVRELRAWMRDHGQDIRSQEAVKRANALLASQAAPDTKDVR